MNVINPIPEKQNENGVWDRMNQNIETFKKIKEMRANPEKFDLYDRYDSTTGQPFFKPQRVTKNSKQDMTF